MIPNRSRLPAAIGAFALLVTPALGQIPGRAFTTKHQGDSAELFGSAAEAYLAGGPRPGANCTAPGLPDGTYFFQVTDVSGSLLLSSDDVLQRAVTVRAGVIASVVAGGHPTLPGPCSSLIVQIAPYAALPELDGTAYCLASIAPAPGYVGSPGGRWVATSPRSLKAPATDPDVKLNFNALFLVNTPELARSKGYWSNQGAGELQACDPVWRETINALCLRTNFSNPKGQAGTLFTVSEADPFATAFAQLSDYLTAPANGVIANILSTQYCAANLNASCGPFSSETVYIDRFADGVLLSFEDLAALTLSLLCDPRSANTGPDGDQEWREVLMGCLNEWDTMNSNGGSIYSGATTRPSFPSPY